MSNNLSQFVLDTLVRDDQIVQMIIMTASAVMTWYAIGFIPWERVRNLAKFGYLAGGIAMYLLTYLVLPR